MQVNSIQARIKLILEVLDMYENFGKISNEDRIDFVKKENKIGWTISKL